jgi:hypothetical protein
MSRRRSNPQFLEPPYYRSFLQHVFERPEQGEDGQDEGFPSFPGEVVALYLHLLRHLKTGLAPYSVEQVARGLDRLFHPGHSDLACVLSSDAIAAAERCAVIRAMAHLYEDLFADRCAPVMSHLEQPGGNALNAVCYMLWDVTPLNYFGPAIRRRDSPERAVARPEADAVFSVLEAALCSENIACVESGLHGLGHMACDWPEEVNAIIGLYLRRWPNHDPRLLRYADLARAGHVQ